MTFELVARRARTRSRRQMPRPLVMLVALICGVALASLVGLAAAKPLTTLKTAGSAKIGKTIVVDARGLTVYELRPETVHRLLCKVKGCFSFWPPVKVTSATTKLVAAPGVKGKLGILHRDGFFQVTLGGHPLYHFAGDASTRGLTGGQGIHSFGGTWHVVVAGPSATTPTTTTTTTTTTPTPSTPTITPTTTTPTTTPTTTTPTIPYYPPLY